MDKSYKVSCDMPFDAKKFGDLEGQNAKTQDFIRILEKNFHEVIWYIGMDLIADSFYERFIFNKGGFMEIKIGKSELKAFFDSKEKAEKFKLALTNSLAKINQLKMAKTIGVKEEFIKMEDLFII